MINIGIQLRGWSTQTRVVIVNQISCNYCALLCKVVYTVKKLVDKHSPVIYETESTTFCEYMKNNTYVYLLL